MKYRYKVGETYTTQSGQLVKVVARFKQCRGYETVVGNDQAKGCYQAMLSAAPPYVDPSKLWESRIDPLWPQPAERNPYGKSARDAANSYFAIVPAPVEPDHIVDANKKVELLPEQKVGDE